ncbi:ATP synthase F1 subunit epsilon [Candidatus Parcubacteria bacterium]|nr:ATP synthase F1 subunit epsilon [Candidatus Parcubacteria bacterium]
MSLKLKIVTPERIVFEDTVDSVTAMTQMGEITVLPGHIPLVANLQAGELRVRANGAEQFLVASTGFLEVRSGNEVVVLADTAERAEELALEQIEQAKRRARELMNQKRAVDEVAFADAAALLERELARERVAMRRKTYRDVGKAKQDR